MLETKSLFLTGYRACGKTSVARRLAQRVGAKWLDLDAEISRTANQTIAQIFEEGGEESFRDLETAKLASVTKLPPQIVSLGGGAILRSQNREMIRESGHCVWLAANVETVVNRLNADKASISQRPGLTDLSLVDEVQEIMMKRTPIYQSVADFKVDTDDRTVDQIVDLIIEWRSPPR